MDEEQVMRERSNLLKEIGDLGYENQELREQLAQLKQELAGLKQKPDFEFEGYAANRDGEIFTSSEAEAEEDEDEAIEGNAIYLTELFEEGRKFRLKIWYLE